MTSQKTTEKHKISRDNILYHNKAHENNTKIHTKNLTCSTGTDTSRPCEVAPNCITKKKRKFSTMYK